MRHRYGALNGASALTGLLFYQEHKELSSWQLGCTIAGVVLILIGIAIGMLGLDAREKHVLAQDT